jgi:hypothetical protein
MSLCISQESYVTKRIDEIQMTRQRQSQTKAPLNPNELSQLRGAIGTLSWKATQTGPHFQADVSLLLSEVPKATVQTILEANKLIRELKRESKQRFFSPSWRRD